MKHKIAFGLAAVGLVGTFLGASGLDAEGQAGNLAFLITAISLGIMGLGLLLEKKNKKSVPPSTITRSKPMT